MQLGEAHTMTERARGMRFSRKVRYCTAQYKLYGILKCSTLTAMQLSLVANVPSAAAANLAFDQSSQ